MNRLLLILLLVSVQAYAVDVGVNIHGNTDTAVSSLMDLRNFKTARMDVTVDSNVANYRAHINRVRANGGAVEFSVQISYQWNNSCPQNFTTVETNSYNETYAIVNNFKDIVSDYELLNEVTLRPETKAEVPYNSAGTSTTPYENKPCYATMVAVLKGMSRAIHDLGTSSGYPLRVILGAVGRDFGFLSFMRNNGVVFDVVGYHIYPQSSHTNILTDTWFGTNGLFYQLSLFNKPVHINEFNCGDIYLTSTYNNQPNSTGTYNCYAAYKKHIPAFYNQTYANVESYHMYELYDEPQKPAPENFFGLLYNSTSPKTHLYIITAFAGGTLSSTERQAVINTGVLTDAEITYYYNLANQGAPPPTPLPDVIVTNLTYSGGVFTATVKNQGAGPTPDGIQIGVGYSVDGVNRAFGLVNGPLAAGASMTIETTSATYVIPSGVHTVQAWVDDINRFAETDENNNKFSITVGTANPDLIVTDVSFANRVKAHTVTISGLTEGTEYHYQVLSKDANNNIRVTPDLTFTTLDTTKPVLSNLVVTPTSNSIEAAWDTNEPSNSRLKFGSPITDSVFDEEKVTSHKLVATGLSPSTLYSFKVQSTDNSGNQGEIPNLNATTSGLITPAISNITESNIGHNTFTAAWTTDIASDSLIEYGLTNSYGSNVSNASQVTSHELDITGLTPFSEYHYRVCSTAQAQNCSIDRTFVTDALPSVSITSVQVSPSKTTATITWTTDGAANSEVQYGTTSSLGLSETDDAFVTSHSVEITGLNIKKKYYFKVRSASVAGEFTESQVFTFNTRPNSGMKSDKFGSP